MARRYILTLVVAALLTASGILLYKHYNSSQPAHDISGQVQAITKNAITVVGLIRSADGKTYTQRTIEFAITPQTIFKKTALVIPKKYQHVHGVSDPFTPATKDYSGTMNDLVVGMRIILLQSPDNLSSAVKAMASQIQYQTFENEK